MNCYIENGKIRLTEVKNFNIRHILDCGQVFRYTHYDTHSSVIAGSHKADIYTAGQDIIIESDDSLFFYDYFDLDTDYGYIIKKVSINPIMERATAAGEGIRILKGGLREIIISFIISSNNNIGRIRGSLNKISECLGKKMCGYYAFPELDALLSVDADFFAKCGCGYRSKYLLDTIKILAETDIENKLREADTPAAHKLLCGLPGVGSKVADCILLFGLGRTDVFPVDTWIKKVYHDEFCGTGENPEKIRNYFLSTFGRYSGYAQQYLFYYKRELNRR